LSIIKATDIISPIKMKLESKIDMGAVTEEPVVYPLDGSNSHRVLVDHLHNGLITQRLHTGSPLNVFVFPSVDQVVVQWQGDRVHEELLDHVQRLEINGQQILPPIQ
jgi:hypothetical protein